MTDETKVPVWADKLKDEYKELDARLNKLQSKLPALRKEASAVQFHLLRMQRNAMRAMLSVLADRLRDVGVSVSELAGDVADDVEPKPDNA